MLHELSHIRYNIFRKDMVMKITQHKKRQRHKFLYVFIGITVFAEICFVIKYKNARQIWRFLQSYDFNSGIFSGGDIWRQLFFFDKVLHLNQKLVLINCLGHT